MTQNQPPQPARSKITVLYIDDDPQNRTLVNRLLTSYGYKILEAANGLDGLAVAQQIQPDLILMDINMPGLDGHETTTRMRGIPALTHTPIVAVTARITRGERELALASGCDGYIPKPIDIDTFPNLIASYLHGYRDNLPPDVHRQYLGQYSQKLVERLEGKIVELETAHKKLQKIDKIKSDFITLAAHELRTPITLIYGFARLLQLRAGTNGADPTAEGGLVDLSGRIFNSVDRLNATVNDILNIALVEADEMRLSREPVSLGQIIMAAMKELNPAKNNRILTIGYEGLDTLPAIIGDASRLQLAFWNLFSNAVKYTEDGGSVFVKGRVVDTPPAIPASALPPAPIKRGGVLVSVKDSGIGINPADHQQIFERFYVVADTAYHSSSKTAFGGGGMGLGLAITRGIINAHGGAVWVNPQTSPGSTFDVFLPLGDPH